MRIIKKGKVKEIECTCKECETIFAYSRIDIRCIHPNRPLYIICPVCEEEIIIK